MKLQISLALLLGASTLFANESLITKAKNAGLEAIPSNKLFIGYGSGVGKAIEVEKLHNEDIAILDLRFVKPLDIDTLINLSKKYDSWYIFSDSSKQGGVLSAILEALSENSVTNISLKSFEYDDNFIEHGDTKKVEESLQLLPKQLVNLI